MNSRKNKCRCVCVFFLVLAHLNVTNKVPDLLVRCKLSTEIPHSRKSGTIRESNQASDVRKDYTYM